MIRITADIDHKNIQKISYKIREAIRLYEIVPERIVIKKSNSKGYHIIIFTKDKLKKNEIMHIRKILGDDEKRLSMDKKRRRPKQYLFKEKIKLR